MKYCVLFVVMFLFSVQIQAQKIAVYDYCAAVYFQGKLSEHHKS